MSQGMLNRKWFTDRLAQQGKSQRGLARFMDIDPSAITHILSGKRKLQLTEAEQFASFLGVPVDEVLTQAGIKLKSRSKAEAAGGTVIIMVDPGQRVGIVRHNPREGYDIQFVSKKSPAETLPIQWLEPEE